VPLFLYIASASASEERNRARISPTIRCRPFAPSGISARPAGPGGSRAERAHRCAQARRVAPSEGQSGVEADPGRETQRGRDVGNVGKDATREAWPLRPCSDH
jgi:hypothetical protein